MNDFVDECRREWKRLGVPASVADGMAEELAADLEEGASAEDVLGADASDPRSFAARWAAERGVIHERRWISRLPAALATAALASAIFGAVLLISATHEQPQRLTLPAPPAATGVWVTKAPPPVLLKVAEENARLAHALVLVQDASDVPDDNHTLGSVLLIVGLALLAPLTLFWVWRGFKRA